MKRDPDDFPPIDLPLVQALELLFPDTGPAQGFKPDEERERAGRLYVVRFLRRTYEEQTKEERD